jgi:hypothetical protein
LQFFLYEPSELVPLIWWAKPKPSKQKSSKALKKNKQKKQGRETTQLENDVIQPPWVHP